MTRSEAAHLLGVTEDAAPADVQSAYRRGMSRWHPDRHRDDPEAARMAQEMAVLLGQARDVLLGRAQEEQPGTPPPPPPPQWACPVCGMGLGDPPPRICPRCGIPLSDDAPPPQPPRKPGPPIPWWVVGVTVLTLIRKSTING